MPFFNFRKAGSAAHQSASAAQPDSVEVIRQRAKHRLIGASVLVLLGVVGFPLLFDTQPRPIAVDIPIEIPGKNTVKPLTLSANSSASTVAIAPAPAAVAPETAAPPVTPAPVAAVPVTAKVAAASSLAPKEEIITEKRPVAQVSQPEVAIKKEAKIAPRLEAKIDTKAEPKVEPKMEPKVAAKVEAKPASALAVDDGARARALLNGQVPGPATTSAPAATEGRMVVQVGAFADATKAHETRLKLEKAGLKTYTQVADTKDGKRIRVRVGPFATKAEADKAASQIKALALPASILIL